MLDPGFQEFVSGFLPFCSVSLTNFVKDPLPQSSRTKPSRLFVQIVLKEVKRSQCTINISLTRGTEVFKMNYIITSYKRLKLANTKFYFLYQKQSEGLTEVL